MNLRVTVLFFLLSTACSVSCFGGMLPVHIIGEDERVQVLDESGFSKYFGYIAGCSATLISPKHLLTAAHCFYNSEKKQLDSNFQGFYPGIFDKAPSSLGKYNWKRVFFLNEYIDFEQNINSGESDNTQLDYAVVELDSEVTYVDPSLIELGSLSLTEKKGTAITMTGYPGEKPHGQMWQSNCFTDTSSFPLEYQCDTTSGQSGSAITVDDATKLHIIGVHSGSRFLKEYREKVLTKSTSYTLGAQLGLKEITQIRKWMQGDISKETYSFENTTQKHTYKLKSDCKDDLLLYYTTDLKHEAIGPFKLNYAKDLLFESQSHFAFLRAESSDGHLSFGSSNEIIIEGALKGAFKMEQSDAIYGGKSTMTLNCQGDYVHKAEVVSKETEATSDQT